MASTIMHIAVAKEIYKNLKDKIDIDYYDYILGSIAPDISKQMGKSKKESHFIDGDDNIPNLDIFLEKYGKNLNKSFNLGYYIHLYTDKLFDLEFLPLFVRDGIFMSRVRLIDGNVYNFSIEERASLIYSDYTNLNIDLIDFYNLDLELFYTDFRVPDTDILECFPDKLNILIDNIGVFIKNSSNDKKAIIDLDSIKSFIDSCSMEIYENIKALIIN